MLGRLLRRVDEFCASGYSLAKNGLQVVAVGSAMAHNLLLGVAFHFQH